MITGVTLVLVIVTFAFIALPFFRQKRHALPSASPKDTRLEVLNSQRNTTYSMLKELEFDYESGILTEEDYHDLQSRYRDKAITILKGIDGVAAADDVPGKNTDGDTLIDDEIEKMVADLRRGNVKTCPRCQTKIREGGRFCHSCGAPLEVTDV